jgi:hypothetical protein
MKQVITHDGKYGVIIFEKHEQCEVRYYNGKTNWYRKHQLTELNGQQVTKPPSRERDALISKYQTMLDDCRNDGAMAVLVMILNDLK